MRYVVVLWMSAAWVVGAVAPAARSEDEIERPPIEYSRGTPENRISDLQQRLDRGELSLDYEDGLGYLPALLRALDVPVESQMLVFSKTSLQRHRIGPETPRAIYFNDDVYLGFCQSGDVLEISAADSRLGTVFYTLDQEQAAAPRLVRQTENCLICHSSSRTEGVPGHVVRSLFVDERGDPIFSAGSFSVDQTTPLEQRWGGWYVTGRHGSQTHLGNLVIQGKDVPRVVENPQGRNAERLDDRLDVGRYPAPGSDIVALMVLEHQTLVHNRITRASFETRQALHYQVALNEALKEPKDRRLESTTRRIQSAGDDLVEALLFVDEAKLTARISGTSGYAEQFTTIGPRDSRGRSLRDFDLERRMFKYPCSYLVYSSAFADLPDEMRDYVWRRLWDVLHGQADAETYSHLSDDDRQAIVEILRETIPDLPDYWRSSDPMAFGRRAD